MFSLPRAVKSNKIPHFDSRAKTDGVVLGHGYL